MLSYVNLNIKKHSKFAKIPIIDSGCKKNDYNIQGYISLAESGNMAVDENRYNLFKELNIRKTEFYRLKQTHSKDICIINDSLPKSIFLKEGDGLITDNKNLKLGVTVADCLPIFLFDMKTGCFGILHSGWKGTGILKKAIEKMKQDFGTNPQDLCITIGPGIGSCCYNVTSDRYEEFADFFGESAVKKMKGEYFLDLREANLNIVNNYNVDNVTIVKDCTLCNNLLNSFRRSVKENKKNSLNLMLACIGYFE